MLGQLKLNFQPKQATREILSFLDKKPRDIIERRFGLGAVPPKTLESIGRDYNITRERVRQIEEDSMRRLKKSENFSKLDDVFNELKINGIDVKWASQDYRLTHAKFIIVDDKAVLVGSHNFSNSAMRENREASVIIRAEKIVNEFKEIFEEDWIKAK